MAPSPQTHKAVEYYIVQLSEMADGEYYVSMTATTVDENEPQLLDQEILKARVASLDDAMAVIRRGIDNPTQ